MTVFEWIVTGFLTLISIFTFMTFAWTKEVSQGIALLNAEIRRQRGLYG